MFVEALARPEISQEPGWAGLDQPEARSLPLASAAADGADLP